MHMYIIIQPTTLLPRPNAHVSAIGRVTSIWTKIQQSPRQHFCRSRGSFSCFLIKYPTGTMEIITEIQNQLMLIVPIGLAILSCVFVYIYSIGPTQQPKFKLSAGDDRKTPQKKKKLKEKVTVWPLLVVIRPFGIDFILEKNIGSKCLLPYVKIDGHY